MKKLSDALERNLTINLLKIFNLIKRNKKTIKMRQAYINIQKIRAQYEASMDNVVEEVLFVTDMDTAFTAATKCRKEIFSGTPIVWDIGIVYSLIQLNKKRNKNFN